MRTGRLVGRLPRAPFAPGTHQVAWKAIARDELVPGVYYVRARLGGTVRSAPAVVIR
jgi:hypothetical protein